MELTLKQKIIIFAVMICIFMASVFLKQWLDKKEYYDALGGGDEKIETEIQSENEENSKNDTEEITEKGNQTGKQNVKEIIIDVEGAVTYPGIVKLNEGSRVYEAVDKAGGLLDNADTKYVNLAEELEDGSNIYIPFKGEENSSKSESNSSDGGDKNSGSKLININKADKSQLMELPGIGEAYAQAIINYREEKGYFKNKEDIKEVSGIGDATFEKLKELICVY